MSLVGPGSKTEISSFLKLCKPSEGKAERGPWYWVQSGNARDFSAEFNPDKLVEEGAKLEKALNKECRRIEAEEPVLGNKKAGRLSQKECKENAYKVFNKGVRKLAKKHGVLSGKWLFFPKADNVDEFWEKIVEAIASADGPLAKFGRVPTAKVSTSLTKGPLHCICVYVDNSWDRAAVEGALKILVGDLGLKPTIFKCDAITRLGIDKDHPSGIPVALWTVSDFMTTHEVNHALAKQAAATKAAFEARAKAAPKKRSVEEEVDDFDAMSSGEEDGNPAGKKLRSA
ncbi:hypothetical protein RQP46_002725 [Phenoliferia psychrophenolica]